MCKLQYDLPTENWQLLTNACLSLLHLSNIEHFRKALAVLQNIYVHKQADPIMVRAVCLSLSVLVLCAFSALYLTISSCCVCACLSVYVQLTENDALWRAMPVAASVPHHTVIMEVLAKGLTSTTTVEATLWLAERVRRFVCLCVVIRVFADLRWCCIAGHQLRRPLCDQQQHSRGYRVGLRSVRWHGAT